jgi:DNA-binding transcriptional regulator YhcF (GntR family)
MLKWEWYDDINTKVLFLHLLLTVNYEDEKWHGTEVKRGQRISSYEKLAKETRLSIQSVRTATKRLISTGELTCESNPQYSVFTVVNYDRFQELTCELTNDQQTTNKPLTNDQQQRKKANKAKKAKKEKEDIYISAQHLFMTKTEYDKLVDKFGEDKVQNKIKYAENYAKLKNYTSLYLTLNNWLGADTEKDAKAGTQQNKKLSFMDLVKED